MKRILPILLLAACAACGTSKELSTMRGPRQNVTGYEGKFVLHPDSVTVQTDQAQIYCLFDFLNKVMYLTDHDNVYREISDFLPTRVVLGRSAVVQGTEINPFTVMTAGQFQQVTERMRLKGIELNGYKVAWLMNYGLYDVAGASPVIRPTIGSRARPGGFQ